MSRQNLVIALRKGVTGTFERWHMVAGFLLANILVAWVLVAPLRGLLRGELDSNLYGDTMATGSSWTWFQTVDRKHPELFGNLQAWHDLLSHRGVGLRALASLSGPAAGAALAGLFLFWLNAVMHCGFLASFVPGERQRSFGAGCAHYALPASALAFFATLSYALVYGLLFVQTGRWTEGLRLAVDDERLALALTGGRLALTLAGFLAVKLIFDLAKVALVEKGNWNWLWATWLGARELARRPGGYALLYLLLGLLTLPWVGGWWLVFGRFVPESWFGLALTFVLQQLFLTGRIGLRLAHLAATQAYAATSKRSHVTPPWRVEPG
jgi:hypothetical protein